MEWKSCSGEIYQTETPTLEKPKPFANFVEMTEDVGRHNPFISARETIKNIMTLDQAKHKVLQAINNLLEDSKYIIDEAGIVDTEHAWYIPYVDVKPDHTKILIGAYKGFIVDKTTEEMHRPGSLYSIDEWLVAHKLGLLNGPHDFVITKVNDVHHTKTLLAKLRLNYFIPEIIHDTTWKIPRNFTEEMIQERLKTLPCTFKNQAFGLAVETFSEIVASKAFNYKLIPVVNPKRGDIGEEMESQKIDD